MNDATTIRPLATAWNGVQNAFIRLPALMMNFTALVQVGELGYRVLLSLPIRPSVEFNSGGMAGKTITMLKDNCPNMLKEVSLRPYGKMIKVAREDGQEVEVYEKSTQSLLCSVVVNVVVSNLLLEFVRQTGGELPPIYNQIGRWITPLRFSSDLHPLISMAFGRN